VETDLAQRWGSIYVAKLAPCPTSEAGEPAMISRALANLERFSVVGRVENLPAFATDIEGVLGMRPDIPHLNPTPVDASTRPPLTSEVRERVEDLCRPNQAIYDAVVAGI
jgi:hypothetical protein